MKGRYTISFIGRVRNGLPLISRGFHGRRRTDVDSLGTRRRRRQARTRRRVSTQGPPFPVIPFPDPSNSPPDNAYTVLNDEKCRPQIIECSPGRPAAKLLAAPPGPDESPPSKHRPVALPGGR